ncbi:Transposon Tf2-8 polyprotein, partial [Aduncisulcus paluster]
SRTSNRKGKPVSARMVSSAHASKVPTEYLSIVLENGVEKPITAVLDSGCEESIIDPHVLPFEGQFEEEEVEVELSLADGSSTMVNRRVKVPLKFKGAFGKDLFISEWMLVLELGRTRKVDALICYSTIKRLDLFGRRGTGIEDEELEEWFDEPQEIDVSGHILVEDDCLRPQLQPILLEYERNDRPDEPSKITPMRLDLLGDCSRLAQPPRRLPFHRQEFVKEQVAEWLHDGIIENSSSEFAAPVVVVPKKGDQLRLCVDYRKTNEHIKMLRFPLPKIDIIFHALEGKKWFAVFDLKAGYHQILMDKSSAHITAFVTFNGLYQFRRVPFGLSIAPAYFQMSMARVFADLLYKTCIVYIDDIIVYGETEQEFVENVQRVLRRLNEYNLSLNRKKCKVAVHQVEYLGFIVDKLGKHIHPSRLQALKEMEPPKSIRAVRRLMGTLNYLREFIKDFAVVTAPISDLLRRKSKIDWTEPQQKAWEEACRLLDGNKTLFHYNPELDLILRTDASNIGMGGMLLQKKDGKELPLAFFAKKFSEQERRWCTLEQEAYAVIWCLRKSRHFVIGRKVEIETDHRNLTFILKTTSPKIMRWRMELAEYQFTITHIPGKENVVADYLSRKNAGGKMQVCSVFKSSLEIDKVADRIKRSQKDNFSDDDKEQYFEVDGFLRTEEGDIAIPDADKELQRELVTILHGHVLGGHHGIAGTFQQLMDAGLWWKSRRETVADVVRSCLTCQKNRRLPHPKVMGSIMKSRPFEEISVDTFGPVVPNETCEYHYLIVIVDNFSRFIELVPAKTATGREAADAIITAVIARHGVPEALRTDGGRQYKNTLMNQLCERLKLAHTITTAHHHEENGIVERYNQEILKHLRKMYSQGLKKSEWGTAVPLIMSILNDKQVATTGKSPRELVYGSRARSRSLFKQLHGDGVEEDEEAMKEVYKKYLALMDLRLEQNITQALDKQEKVQDAQTKRYDKAEEFSPGEKVLLERIKRQNKSQAINLGPYVVERQKSRFYYIIKGLNGEKPQSVHISRLRRYISSASEEEEKESQAIDEEEYQIEEILAHRGRKGRRSREFKVKWMGYEEEEATWLPFSALKDAEKLEDYLKEHPALKKEIDKK